MLKVIKHHKTPSCIFRCFSLEFALMLVNIAAVVPQTVFLAEICNFIAKLYCHDMLPSVSLCLSARRVYYDKTADAGWLKWRTNLIYTITQNVNMQITE